MFYGISVVYDISLSNNTFQVINYPDWINQNEMNLQFEKQLFEYDFLKFYSEGL